MSVRQYRLEPWLIRALIPKTCRGTYVLWSPAGPVYVGRDPDLRSRLLEHAGRWPAIFFTYDVTIALDDDEAIEQLRLEQLADHLAITGRPFTPSTHEPGCPFCADGVDVMDDPAPPTSVPA
jgi:hypothetical protein